jgi:hypothetical protein
VGDAEGVASQAMSSTHNIERATAIGELWVSRAVFARPGRHLAGAWTVPAAQMGASFLVDAQAVVFDPISSRVWLPKN